MEQERQEQTARRHTPRPAAPGPAPDHRPGTGSSAVAGPRIPVEQGTRIEELLRAPVAAHPDRTAVTSEHGSLTYRELDRRANRLARTLRAAGAGPGTQVAVSVERSCEMLVAVFAVLKAGAAYVPVDLSHPPARNAYILRDCRADVVITAADALEPSLGATTVVDPYAPGSYDSDDSPVPHDGGGTDVAYVIYTSGSTGEPKGVMVEHRSVINRLRWMQRAYPLGAEDVILQKTPVGFDVSVWELFWWTLAGASVHLLEPGGERNPDTIAAAVEARRVTTLHFVPSMLHAFLEHTDTGTADGGRDLSSLRRVFASGEALTPHHVRRFHQVLGGAPSSPALVNLYGPTEATVDVTHHACTDPSPHTVPIGRPIDNVRLYVLDERLQPCPAGEAGELCIAGLSLARGYLGRDRLTAERFVQNPFPGERRVYRTGDLARLLPDGTLEYLGRNDHQVKIRGVRVEPGEVESALLSHPAVTAAVVVARQSPTGEAYLCAYTVCRREVPVGELRSHAARLLPAALVPAHVLPLPALPLTPNGKLDRAALPEPAAPESAPGEPDSADGDGPAARAERLVASAWAKVLGVPAETLGRADNFYDLGGTSLAVLAVAAELRDHLRLSDLMRQSQLGPLADALVQRASEGERRS
ncbi:non-ribosomal peptide synthetase [Streptomyces caniferus]|uniref:non-ribosomal peptide synthetase n=1 Tax=Streptomyces caniferus TaxID=285557 RepID=UPI002E2CB10C|nr:non-ribosomal peptide synthetase [Streptomyces caniferus]